MLTFHNPSHCAFGTGLFALVRALIVGLVLVVATASVDAQVVDDRVSPSPDVDRMIEGWRAQLDQITSAIQRPSVTDRELSSFRVRLIEIRSEARALSSTLAPEIERLTSELQTLTQAENATLVPPPAASQEETGAADGEPTDANNPSTSDGAPTEPPRPLADQPPAPPGLRASDAEISVAEQALLREIGTLEERLAVLNARLGRTQVIASRADELIETIQQVRRDNFSSRLFGVSQSLASPALWFAALQEVPSLARGFVNLVEGGFRRIFNEAPLRFVVANIVGIVLLYLLLTKVSFLRLTDGLHAKHDNLSEARRATLERRDLEKNALRRVVRTLITFALIPWMVLIALNEVNVFPERLWTLLWSSFITFALYAIALGLSAAIFAPRMPSRRLVDLDDGAAWRISRTVVICATIVLVGFITLSVARTLVASLEVIIVIFGVTSVSFAVTALGSYAVRARAEGQMEDEKQVSLVPDILVLRILALFAVAGLLVAFFAPFVGYSFLGAFAVVQVTIAGILAGSLYLLFRFMDAYVATPAPDSETGVPVIRQSDQQTRRYTQLKLILSGLGKVGLTLFGLLIIAATWGLDTASIWEDLAQFFTEIRIGTFTFSPAVIVGALLVFALGVMATRAVQRWLSTRFLPTTTLDIGLRNSITTGLGYVGYIVAAMIAFSQAGLDLGNLAIVAGALSLGIGFGLQSIVSNFVSGIILLAERPIKAGDWIEVGGEQGTVRNISVRSTEIETFDRATVLVPNADFISGTVKNMMYGNTIGRFILPIGVSYDSDPDQVRNILLDCARNHPLVLAYPEAHVLFNDFGASSLDFELRGFLADCGNGLSVRSDLRFAILKRFREEGIEIPFPQRDLNVKGLDEFKELMGIEHEEALAPDRAEGQTLEMPKRRSRVVKRRRDEVEEMDLDADE